MLKVRKVEIARENQNERRQSLRQVVFGLDRAQDLARDLQNLPRAQGDIGHRSQIKAGQGCGFPLQAQLGAHEQGEDVTTDINNRILERYNRPEILESVASEEQIRRFRGVRSNETLDFEGQIGSKFKNQEGVARNRLDRPVGADLRDAAVEGRMVRVEELLIN